jgi:hypothetical protein
MRMPGRRTVVAGLAAVTAFSGGAAIAATHGSSHPAKPPPAKARTMVSAPNVHYPCRGHAPPPPL